MPPKKGKKGKGKKKRRHEDDVMHFVDKQFYELTITDLNRKLARLRARTAELEELNIQLEARFGKLDEDRGDIICYLKRNLSDRNNEVVNLQATIASLTEENALQQQKHEEELEKCHDEYQEMRENLTAQMKLLISQLNALEDFRMQRDDLMRRFEEVKDEFDAMELKYKKEIYELEKKAIIDRANLKREMEERMFGLANQFQEANRLRIAATSQRMVRENIAINNEMNNLITSTNELDSENLLIRQQFKKVLYDYNILEEENRNRIQSFAIQAGVIKELTNANLQLKESIEQYEQALQEGLADKRKLQQLYINEGIFKNKQKILENRLNAYRYSQKDLQTDFTSEKKFRSFLEELIDDVRLYIKSIWHNYPKIHPKFNLPEGGNILDNIIEMLLYSRADVEVESQVSTVVTPLPKTPVDDRPVIEQKPPVKLTHAGTHLGVSFEDFVINQQTDKSDHTTASSFTSTSTQDLGSSSEEIVFSTSSDEQSTSSSYSKSGKEHSIQKYLEDYPEEETYEFETESEESTEEEEEEEEKEKKKI